jgi:hypothetical protein
MLFLTKGNIFQAFSTFKNHLPVVGFRWDPACVCVCARACACVCACVCRRCKFGFPRGPGAVILASAGVVVM